MVKQLFFVIFLFFIGCGDNNSSTENTKTECTGAQTQEQKCGDNDLGTQKRTCVDEKWGEWSECIYDTDEKTITVFITNDNDSVPN